ncbi:ATP-binding protein [Paroceanicella profunda]|uniref:ATP-binding protein n=1 Tax=Paroceanicella profunda TaxID=2579971 RepID=UPI001EF0A56D|nr:ATP-binding protein [Paroceanicella profunda]
MSQKRAVQHPILVGLRGVGKTVLLVKAREMAETHGHYTIEIEAHEGKSLAELLAPGLRKTLYALSSIENAKDKARRGIRVLKSLLSGIKINISGFEIGVDAETGTADSGDIEADLPEMIVALGEAASAAGKSVSLIVDEIQYLSSREFSALIMALHKANQRSLPLALIGAGLPQLLGLAGNSKSYSERLFSYPTIGALTEEDAITAVVNPSKEEGVEFLDGAVDLIMRRTECYPYFLQQWAYDSWNVASGHAITEKDVVQATEKSLVALDESFFKVRFERCTPSEKRYMRALAEHGTGAHRSGDIAEALGMNTTSAAPTRSNLIKKGMIYSPAYGDTAFTVPLFDEYMRRTIPNLEVKKRQRQP